MFDLKTRAKYFGPKQKTKYPQYWWTENVLNRKQMLWANKTRKKIQKTSSTGWLDFWFECFRFQLSFLGFDEAWDFEWQVDVVRCVNSLFHKTFFHYFRGYEISSRKQKFCFKMFWTYSSTKNSIPRQLCKTTRVNL